MSLFWVEAPGWRSVSLQFKPFWPPLSDNFSWSEPEGCRGSTAGEQLIYLRLNHKARKLAGSDHWSCANIKDDMCTHTRHQTCKASLQLSDGGLDEDEFVMRLNWQRLICPTRWSNRKQRKSGWTCGCKPVEYKTVVVCHPLLDTIIFKGGWGWKPLRRNSYFRCKNCGMWMYFWQHLITISLCLLILLRLLSIVVLSRQTLT